MEILISLTFKPVSHFLNLNRERKLIFLPHQDYDI